MSSTYFDKKDIEGKTVIEQSGRAVGKARDIAFSLDGAIALVVVRDDGSELEVPMNKILSVADFIVLKAEYDPRQKATGSTAQLPQPPPPVTQPTPSPPVSTQHAIPTALQTCPHCGASTKTGSKFCTRCGSPMTSSPPPAATPVTPPPAFNSPPPRRRMHAQAVEPQLGRAPSSVPGAAPNFHRCTKPNVLLQLRS